MWGTIIHIIALLVAKSLRTLCSGHKGDPRAAVHGTLGSYSRVNKFWVKTHHSNSSSNQRSTLYRCVWRVRVCQLLKRKKPKAFGYKKINTHTHTEDKKKMGKASTIDGTVFMGPLHACPRKMEDQQRWWTPVFRK